MLTWHIQLVRHGLTDMVDLSALRQGHSACTFHRASKNGGGGWVATPPCHQLVKLGELTGTCSESAAWDRGARAAMGESALGVLPPLSCTTSGIDCVFAFGSTPPRLPVLAPPSFLDLRCRERMPRKLVFLGLGKSELLPSPTGLDLVFMSFDVSVGEFGHDSLFDWDARSSAFSPATSVKGLGTDLHRSCLVESCRPLCLPSAAKGEVFFVPEAGWERVLRRTESRGRLPNSGADLLIRNKKVKKTPTHWKQR